MTRVLRWICDPDKLEAIEEFALEIHGGQAISATLDGARVPEGDLVQTGDTLIIRGGDHGADFHIAIKPEGGIEWYPRRSVSH